MDLRELENYRLSDAVKFNDRLNPRIWGPDEQMLPQVRERLLAIADDFRESLGIGVEVKDITVSGSNAAYTYTPHSDIDLHLVTDLPRADDSEVYRELFDAKKYQYNDQHDFKIGGYDVELYVQDARKPHHSQGIYSVLHDKWVRVPNRRQPDVDDISVKSKYEDLASRIDQAIESGDLDRMDKMATKIRELRQSGLDQHGEFGPENLAFKVLRGNGTLERLRNARLQAKDQLMSLSERKKKRSKRRWGSFGGYFYPGFGYGSTEGSDAGGGGDGGGESRVEDYDPNDEPPGPEFKPEMPAGTVLVNVSDVYDWYKLGQDISDLKHADPRAYGKGAPQTVLSFGSEPIEHLYKKDLDRLGMKTLDIDRRAKNKDPEGAYRMDEDQGAEHMLERFIAFAAGQLGIDHMPKIKFRRDPAWSERNNTFGRYKPEENTLYVSLVNRHPLDIMRTVAHELAHHRQNEISPMPEHSGDTGSDWENEANAAAGIIMRRYADLNPEYFGNLDEGIKSKLGALAAAACVAGTPGCATTGTDAIQGAQAIGRAIQATKPYGTASRGDIIRAGAKEEFQQAMKDWIRNGRQGAKPSPSPELVDQWRREAQSDMRKESIQTPVAKNQKAHDDYYKFLHMKANLGRPMTRQEQEFIKTYRLAQQMRKQVAEASGYIPTEKQKNDPRFKMALTVDVQPGQTGKEANKLGLKTDSQGRPQLLMKKLNNLLEAVKLDEKCWDGYQQQGMKRKGNRMVPNCVEIDEEEDLLEVKMNPTSLEDWARSPEAQGLRAGFEAEMIFRNTKRDDDDEEMEPDYDADERAFSVAQVVDFFANDDYGYGMTQRQQDRLEERLDETYMEWRDSQIIDDFGNEAEDLVREVLLDDTPLSDRIYVYLTDALQKSDEEADRIIAAGSKAPSFTKNSDQEAYAAENSDYEQYLEAADAVDTELQEQVEDSIRRQDGYYDTALDNFRDNWSGDDDSFFSDVGLRWMSDIANEFGLDWPYYTGSSQGGGERDWEDIGSSLQSAVDMPVKVSSGYHSATRRDDRWIIEPDGSLDPDDYEDMGLEIVSPPMPLPETLDKLKAVIEWGNNEADAYTNSSTGLHMGISIPYVGGDVDYVKLVLFMGDEYILDKFGRASNTYAASAMSKLRQNMAGARNRGELTEAKLDPLGALELVQKNLIELAARYVQDGVGLSKYTSAHIKDGYIEFRSPGGDYLSMESRGEYDDIKNTMLRFARAMQIAGSPSLERREYAKKLYKLISPGAQDDGLKLFSEYAAGTISPEQLKKQWADAVLQKEIPTTGKEEYEVYRRDNKDSPDGIVGTFYATDYDSAYDLFLRQYGKDINELEVRIKQPWFDVKDSYGDVFLTVRARDIDQATQKVQAEYGDRLSDDWKVFRRPDETPEPKNKLSPRAQVAKRLKEPKVSPEVAADNAQDSKDLQARIGEPQPAGAVRDTGYYRVIWRERRNGQEVQDSLNVDAENANAAMDRVRSALQAQRRDIVSIEANPQEPPAWRRMREFIPASTQQEFSGRWQIRNANTNEVLHTFGGIGNSQADANRVAQRWAQQSRIDDPLEVVPEMR